MRIEPIAEGDSKFEKLASELGSAFVQSWWLNALGEEVERLGVIAQDGQLIGGFVLHSTKLKGVSCLANPPFTPHIGLFTKQNSSNPARIVSATKELLRTLVEYLEGRSEKIIDIRLPFTYIDLQEFYWSDFDVSPRYTYRLDLDRSEEDILASMDPKTRNAIKAAESNGIEVIEASEIETNVTAILKEREAKVRLDLLSKLFSSVEAQNRIGLLARSEHEDEALAYCIVHGGESYYLFGGNKSSGTVGSSGSLIMWSAIKAAKSKGVKTFDFEGSMIPGVEKFFRGFGGELTTYFAIQKIPIAYRVAAKIAGKKF